VQLSVLQEGEQPLGPGLAVSHEAVDLIDEQDVAVSHHLQRLGCVLVADQPGELDHAGAQLERGEPGQRSLPDASLTGGQEHVVHRLAHDH